MIGRLAVATLRRDLQDARSYRVSIVLELLGITATLLIFGGIGRLVDPGVARLGSDYLPFAMIGVIVLHLGQSGLASSVTRVRTEQTTGTLEALLVGAAPPWAVLGTQLIYPLLRSLLIAVTSLLVVVVALHVHLDATAASVAACVTGVSALLVVLAGVGFVLSAVTIVVKQVTSVIGVTTSALALMSTAYFPARALPAPLDDVARALPTTWAVTVMRDGLLHARADWAMASATWAAAVVAAAVGGCCIELAVRDARRRGTLSQY